MTDTESRFQNQRVKMTTLALGGTDVTATAAEINAIAGGGLSAAELGVLDAVTPGTITASKAVVVDSGKKIGSFGSVALDGTTVNSLLGMVTVGTVVTDAGADVSANVGRVAGLSVNMKNTAGTVTGLRGVDSRVTDAGGTADNLVGLQAVVTKSSGTTTGEAWGTNSILSMTGGSVVNAYGVVGDLSIGTGSTISTTLVNGFCAAGFFQSFVHSGVTISNAIDAAVIGCISSDTGRGKSTKGTFGVVAMLNGAINQSTAGASAGFKVMDFNTGANFDYGLDLYYSDGSYSNVFASADIRLQNQMTITNDKADRTMIGAVIGICNDASPADNAPASGCVIYFDGTDLKAKNASGQTATLNNAGFS